MIAGNLGVIVDQVPADANLQTAFDFLNRKAWEELPIGRFNIDGNVWGIVQAYQTEPIRSQEFETHRHHIDVHYLVTGEEVIYWIPANRLTSHGTYDEKRDVWITTLAVDPNQVTPLRLRAGEVAVFFPSDGHWPRRASNLPVTVKKILLKVTLYP